MTQTEEIQIRIRNLHKTFPLDKRLLGGYRGQLEVLKGVDLDIRRGEIFGVVGFSGAGKSTLVRCINRLEEPDAGTVHIDGVDITSLSKKDLNTERRKIGMIFQTFNLFESKTVYGNVAYALSLSGEKLPGEEKDRRVTEMLELVGLTEKRFAYPGELSGGQKQRVGIARALINHPQVLLSDEATSALDPQTTLSVLDLLKSISEKLGLTIILITHELEVIRYACDRMASLEEGEIREQGSVRDVFLNPNSATGKIFLKVNANFQKSSWVKEGGDGI
jgi:D-methionine transport system ATP-binding protein